ncbi:MAG: BREX-3 system phosphatase PglZ [Sphingobacteriales bacterium]|nr:MAG: BREX-3 system phosphatase PglZ [Sphingobacteriales bacterium]
MSNWTDKYLRLITSTYKHNIILDDQDNLLQYEELRSLIMEAGYQLLAAKNDFDVRLIYELQVNGSEEKSIIVAPVGYKPLPDIRKNVHFQQIGLSQLFPNLDSTAIKGLSYNALCLLSNIRPYEELGQDRTLKFLLENLYHVDFDTLTQSKPRERVLNALITVLLEKNGINEALLQFLSRLSKSYLPSLLSTGLTKQNLIGFLQKQWEAYLTNGSVDIDFEEPMLSKSIGYLFVFEFLKPVQVSEDRLQSLPKALRIGAFLNKQQNNDNELEGLIQYLEQQKDTIEDLYDQWFTLVQVMANAKLKALLSKDQSLQLKYTEVEASLNERFQRFIDNSYTGLFSLSGIRKPIVVSRILDHLKGQPSCRKALLVIDGMNYWQWDLLSHSLRETSLVVHQSTSMAYIPTITAWSRQAIFKGEKPDPKENNSKEAELFERYWRNNGFNSYQIGFGRLGVTKSFDIQNVSDDIMMLGLVCKDLDDIMHGSILGDRQLKISTVEWIEQSRIVEQIIALHNAGFAIFVTSDHGNIEAVGVRNLKGKEKVGALSRSKRHLYYDNETVLSIFEEENQNLNYGTKHSAIYLRDKTAFAEEKSVVITHGGSHLWEVLVPFITIK